jgi:hypothetical protein
MNQATKPWLLLTAPVITASAACGGGGTETADESPPAGDIEMTDEEAPPVERSDEATGPYAEFCTTFLRVLRSTPTSTADKAQTLEQTKAGLKQLVPVAPDEIKGDLQKFSDYVDKQTDPKMMDSANMPPEIKAIEGKPFDFVLKNCDNMQPAK